MIVNPRTAWMTDDLIKQLRKIPINKDYSPRNHYPYLSGPIGARKRYQVKAHDPELGASKAICTCKDIFEAANIVMLIAQQFVDIEKQIKDVRKAMNVNICD